MNQMIMSELILVGTSSWLKTVVVKSFDFRLIIFLSFYFFYLFSITLPHTQSSQSLHYRIDGVEFSMQNKTRLGNLDQGLLGKRRKREALCGASCRVHCRCEVVLVPNTELTPMSVVKVKA